jgi:hypothetical protein
MGVGKIGVGREAWNGVKSFGMWEKEIFSEFVNGILRRDGREVGFVGKRFGISWLEGIFG